MSVSDWLFNKRDFFSIRLRYNAHKVPPGGLTEVKFTLRSRDSRRIVICIVGCRLAYFASGKSLQKIFCVFHAKMRRQIVRGTFKSTSRLAMSSHCFACGAHRVIRIAYFPHCDVGIMCKFIGFELFSTNDLAGLKK